MVLNDLCNRFWRQIIDDEVLSIEDGSLGSQCYSWHGGYTFFCLSPVLFDKVIYVFKHGL